MQVVQSREALLRLLEPGGAANESLRADMIMHHAAHGPKIQDSDLVGLDVEAAQRLRALQVLQSALGQGRGLEVPEFPEKPGRSELRREIPVDTVAGMAVHELLIPLPGKSGRSLRLLEAADSNEATEAFRALGHQDPFGSKAWPSAYLVAERLLSEEVFRDNSSASVLELGCGTGLVSLAALIGGATNVLATDQAKVNLDLAQKSAQLNGLHLAVEVFDVTSDAPLPRCLGSKAFDYVVFSDVLYWPAEAAAFASRAAEAYCEGSTVIMADPGRRRDDFIGALRKELEKRVGSANFPVAPEATKFPDHVFQWVSSEVKTASSLFCQEPFILTLRPNPPVFKVPAVFELVD